MNAFLLAVLLSLSTSSFGKNDWTQACLNGACSYDIEEGPSGMGGSIAIVRVFDLLNGHCSHPQTRLQSGSPSAISDITSAAGWSIVNCTDTTNSQTIQIVCTDESKECGHLFQDGAQDTIIRLPESVSIVITPSLSLLNSSSAGAGLSSEFQITGFPTTKAYQKA